MNSSEAIKLNEQIGNSKMRFEVSYQSEVAQQNFDEANAEVIYCFENKALKQAKLLKEAKRFGRGVLFVVNGNNIIEEICF